MHSSILITVLAVSASSVLADLHFPDSFPLHKRQDLSPGSPQYECHANCGGVIVDARTDGYCSSDTYQSQLAACLDCALTFDIWQYYGNSVSEAADACGDDATPSPSSATSAPPSTTTEAPTTETSTTAEVPTTPAPASTTESSSTTMTSTPENSAVSVSPSSSTNSTIGVASPTPSTEPFTGAAATLGSKGQALPIVGMTLVAVFAWALL